MNTRLSNIEIEGAKFAYKPNFSGRKSDTNPQGFRGFTIILDEETGRRLEEDGWKIKWKPIPRNTWVEGDPLTATLEVKVRMDEDAPYPAEVYLIDNGRKHRLYEDEVHILDEASFETIDMIIRPYQWEMNGKGGVKAYLKTLYAAGIKNTITAKYIDIPLAED